MDYQMLVRNLFNDMFVFFNGTQPLGLEPLVDVYQDEPLLMAFIGRLDEAVKVPYNDVMKECYGFFKQYAGGEYTDEVWERIVKDIQDFNQKWINPWCRGIMLVLLELLEREDKERQELQNQGSLVENEAQAPGLQETEEQYEADGQYEDGQYEIETGQEGMEPGLEAGGETALPEMEMGYGEDRQQENDLAA
ncbi:hypothetical protein AALB64_01365 [Lachnospiraceae bacterium 45-P1]